MGRVLLFASRDSPLQALVAALLPDRQVTALAFEDPFRGLEAEAPPDLMVLDLAAGTWQCSALVQTVRQRHPGCRILALFGRGRRQAAAEALVAGADALLPVPFRFEELRALLHRLLGRPGAGAAVAPAAPGGGEAPVTDLDGLSVFVRGLAHEVNNPLATIRGLLQLLLHADEAGTRSEEALEAYQTMDAESQRIAEVIQELEFFSGTRRPSKTQLDIGQMIKEALSSLGLDRLRPKLPRKGSTLLADRDQLSLALRQMFGFLATHASSGAAKIEIQAAEEGSNWVIRAAGQIEAAAIAQPGQLMIPLYSGRRGESGERAGLAGAYGIARAHGGRLDIARDGGNGVVLTLTLPNGETGP